MLAWPARRHGDGLAEENLQQKRAAFKSKAIIITPPRKAMTLSVTMKPSLD
jgi:hypothetical protein